ncbi:RcnB family protein [Dyella marensis]|jgi:Ni/Co efflux regulator RcnB|uniref:Regulator RcnB of Ni and Co efflux n=1 Tax=Dyella marensis TaxID=500610 RepID=A0A1I2BSI4_9GAMM|nr:MULTISPECIES: RcnB family protein [Dyella]SFE59034.1 regulator RcnB of Ni and Co efflux [Dyella marensis]
MKRLLSLALAAVLLAGGGVAFASPQDGHGHGHGRGNDSQWDDDDGPGHGRGHNPKDEGRHDNGRHNGWYKKGERLPDRYYSRTYYVTDYEHYHLRRPEPGYRWVRADGGQFYLTLVSSGVVIDIATGL